MPIARAQPMWVPLLTAALATTVMIACGGGGVADKPVGPGPVTPVDTTKPPIGTVQRATLAVTVGFDTSDASLASTAGVTRAGITVRIQRVGTTEPARTAVTGADGVARFTDLLEGGYQVTADRPLTAAEVARLPEADREASLFAGGTGVTVRPPQGQASVELVASRRGSLVLSEVFLYHDRGAPNFYGWGTYYEVYNNADTTSYLDGVLFFSTDSRMHRQYAITGGCAASEALRTDPLGLWIGYAQAFPGSGRDYPIRPGEAKVVAMDALNHAAASPATDQVDLSAAHFEEIGTDADINNPFVPDMIRVVGTTGALGRGHPLSDGRAYGLALPSARARLGPSGNVGPSQVIRLPRDAVLDVVGLEPAPGVIAKLEALGAGWAPECTPWLRPEYERARASLGDLELRMAIARRSLGRTAAGHEILQRTRTSARDFIYAEPLRRSLLKP